MKRTPIFSEGKDFEKSIPTSIRDEIDYVVDKTKKTGSEQSLTFCRLPGKDKIYVSDYAVGNKNQTYIMPCNSLHGKAEKIGDLHTHPTQDKTTIGITPSTADLASTLLESVGHRIPQISCITSADARHIHCYQPRPEAVTNPEKVRNYRKALYYNESSITDVHPYLRQNVANDFNHAFYDRKTFKRVKPTPKEVVKDAFLNSRNLVKFHNVHDLDKEGFCSLIEDLNYPSNNKVAEECKKDLKVRNFLGFRY